MQNFWKWIRRLLLALAAVLLVLVVLVNIPAVQTWAAQRVANYLSDEMETTISLEKVKVKFIKTLVLEGLYIEDHSGDTLAYLNALAVNGIQYNRHTKDISLGNVTIQQPYFNLVKDTASGGFNVDFLKDYFTVQSDSLTEAPLLAIDNITLISGRYRYTDHRLAEGPGRIDYGSLSLSQIDIEGSDFRLQGDSLSAAAGHVSLRDQSGFELDRLSGNLTLYGNVIALDQSVIQFGEADIRGRVAFKFKSRSDFSEFVSKVRMNHNFGASTMNLGDLVWFTDFFDGIDRNIRFRGVVQGKVNSLKSKNLELEIDENTRFRGDITMNGLPEIDNTFITLDITELTTNKASLDKIPIPPFTDGIILKTPENFVKLGTINFKGNFAGFINDFTAYGQLTTRIGSIRSDISLKENNETYEYEGQLITQSFDLGKFYSQQDLGKLTSSLKVKGSGLTIATADAKVEGTVQSFVYNNYDYRNIKLKGDFARSFFNGNLNISDDNLVMVFDGKLDFTKKIPAYTFQADIANADLVDLNFLPELPFASVSAQVDVNAKGLNFDTLEGTLIANELSFCAATSECEVNNIELIASRPDGRRRFDLKSSIADGYLKGNFDLAGLQSSVMTIIGDWIPAMKVESDALQNPQRFEVRGTINNFEPISDLFIPELTIAPGTYLDLAINDQTSNFELLTTSDSVRYKNMFLDAVTLDAQRQDSAIYFNFLTDNIFVSDSLNFSNLSLDGRTETDTIFTSVAWDNTGDGHSGELNNQLVIRGTQNFDITFNSATILLNNEPWVFNPKAFVQIDSTRIEFNNFKLSKGREFASIEGIISEHPKPWLDIELEGFKIENFNPFLKESGVELTGAVFGTTTLRDFYNQRLIQTDILALDVVVNDYELGDICVESSWDRVNERMILAGELTNDKSINMTFGGFYTPSNEDSPIDLDVRFNKMDLHFVNAFIDEGISNLNGSIDGLVHVDGIASKPLLKGSVKFNNARAKIDYLGTTYTIEDSANIYPDMFTLDNVRVFDEEGNRAYVIGTIIHDNFSSWNFDVFLDLEEKPLLCMNTTRFDNGYYYGKAYGKGYVNIYGFHNNLEFDINLKSEKGTSIVLPLEGSEEVTFEDFVTFVGDEVIEENLDLDGIKLNFELDITPDAEFMIIFDEAAGDIIRGRSQGHISMDISSLGEFTMRGMIEVLEGNYLFTLKNLINKEFEILPGGTISWYGDPLAADLDIQTVYKLSAPLYDLLGDASQYSSRVPVELVLALQGNMLNPGINFDIRLPSVDDITRTRVSSIVNTEQEINRQAFSLLILRRFVSPPNISSSHTTDLVAANSSELLSNQLSNWLSKISDDFDIGFNYRPGDEISNDEIAVALSTQLFNERLQLSGNFGVSQNSNDQENPSNIIGDLKIEYKITKDGKIRLLVYNKSNEFDIANTNQSPYSQGVGLLYKEEFNTMSEFYCGFKNLFRKTDEREQCN